MYHGGPALERVLKRAMPIFDASAVADMYTPARIGPVLDTNANVYFLLFDSGFSPEDAGADEDAFAASADCLHSQGCMAMASIAPGHAAGLRDSGIFALRPGGKRIPSWLAGFDMTCWLQPAWRARVHGRIERAIELGADGVWFDPVIFGAAPGLIGGQLIGPAGCSCELCRKDFQSITGGEMRNFPPRPDAEPDLFERYIQWRSDIVADAVSEWAAAAYAAKPGALIAAALLHPAHLPAALLFGADINKLAPRLDIVIAETNNMIHFEKSGLTYDAATIETIAARAPGCALATWPHARGPHIDFAPAAVLWRAAMAEAAACRASYAPRLSFHLNKDTLQPITPDAEDFETHRQALGAFWNWIDRTPEPFHNTTPHAQTGLVHSHRAQNDSGGAFIAAYVKMFITMTELHIPFIIVTEEQLEAGAPPDCVKLLVAPPGAADTDAARAGVQKFAGSGGRLLFAGAPPDWAPVDNRQHIDPDIFTPTPPGKSGLLRGIAAARHSGTPAPYFQHRFPAAGPVAKQLRDPGRFLVPEQWKTIFDALKAILADMSPDVEIEGPPYIHCREYRGPGAAYFHCANILPGFPGQPYVRLRFPGTVRARILTPDRNRVVYTQDRSITLEVKTYAVIEITDRRTH